MSEVWVIESDDGTPVTAECEREALPGVRADLGESLVKYVRPSRIPSTVSALERLATVAIDEGSDRYARLAARLADQLEIVRAACAGTVDDVTPSDATWSPALPAVLTLRVELARARLLASDMAKNVTRVLTGARLSAGGWVCVPVLIDQCSAALDMPVSGDDLFGQDEAEAEDERQLISAVRVAYRRWSAEPTEGNRAALDSAFLLLPCPYCRQPGFHHKMSCYVEKGL